MSSIATSDSVGSRIVFDFVKAEQALDEYMVYFNRFKTQMPVISENAGFAALASAGFEMNECDAFDQSVKDITSTVESMEKMARGYFESTNSIAEEEKEEMPETDMADELLADGIQPDEPDTVVPAGTNSEPGVEQAGGLDVDSIGTTESTATDDSHYENTTEVFVDISNGSTDSSVTNRDTNVEKKTIAVVPTESEQTAQVKDYEAEEKVNLDTVNTDTQDSVTHDQTHDIEQASVTSMPANQDQQKTSTEYPRFNVAAPPRREPSTSTEEVITEPRFAVYVNGGDR